MIGTIRTTTEIGSLSCPASVTTRTAEGEMAQNPALPAAALGSLTTRTDDDTGEATMSEGHGVVTGTVNVFWNDGVCYGMDAVVTDNAIALDSGAGDALPTQDTAVYIANVVTITTAFDGDDLKLIAAQSDVRAHMAFITGVGGVLLGQELIASEQWSWADAQGIANPLTGTAVATIDVSAGEATAGTFYLGAILDSV